MSDMLSRKISEAIWMRIEEIANERKLCIDDLFGCDNSNNESTILDVQNIYSFCNRCGVSLREFFKSELFQVK